MPTSIHSSECLCVCVCVCIFFLFSVLICPQYLPIFESHGWLIEKKITEPSLWGFTFCMSRLGSSSLHSQQIARWFRDHTLRTLFQLVKIPLRHLQRFKRHVFINEYWFCVFLNLYHWGYFSENLGYLQSNATSTKTYLYKSYSNYIWLKAHIYLSLKR